MSYLRSFSSPCPFSLKRAGQGVLVSLASLLCWSTSARAAETVILQYGGLQGTIPVADLETLSSSGQTTPALQAFLDQTPIKSESMSVLLAASIPDTGIPLGDRDIQYLLYELNKLVGDPLGRENLRPLGLALRSAYLDSNMSFLELVKRYPKSTVKLNVNQLNGVYEDVDLFVQRISPLLNYFGELLPDLVCDCQLKTDVAQGVSFPLSKTKAEELKSPSSEVSLSSTPQTLLAASTKRTQDVAPLSVEPEQRIHQSDCSPKASFRGYEDSTNRLQAQNSRPSSQLYSRVVTLSQEVKTPRRSNYVAPRVSQKVVISLGPFGRSFSIEDLTTFAQTGKYPQSWNFFFKVAKTTPEGFRKILTTEFDVKLSEIDRDFNNLLGEYVLFRLGDIIRTPSRKANVQALRSMMVLSAVDGKVTPLELLQTYPAPELDIDAARLLRFTRRLETKGAVKSISGNVEDILVAAQSAIAKDVCDCVDPDTEGTQQQ